MLAPWKKSYGQPRQHTKKQRHYFANKGLSSQGYGFSTEVMWQLNCEKSWALKNWCFWTMVLEKTLESPLDCKQINQSILKIGPGCSLEGLMLKLKLQDFGHLMWRTSSLESTLMVGGIEDGRRRGWQRMRWLDGHHRLDGHEFEWTLGVGDGQGSLACCSPWGCKVSDINEWPNWLTSCLQSSIEFWFPQLLLWGFCCWLWSFSLTPLWNFLLISLST